MASYWKGKYTFKSNSPQHHITMSCALLRSTEKLMLFTSDLFVYQTMFNVCVRVSGVCVCVGEYAFLFMRNVNYHEKGWHFLPFMRRRCGHLNVQINHKVHNTFAQQTLMLSADSMRLQILQKKYICRWNKPQRANAVLLIAPHTMHCMWFAAFAFKKPLLMDKAFKKVFSM